MTSYKFHIDLPSGEVEFHPKIPSVSFENKPFNDECFFREDIGFSLNVDDSVLFKDLYIRERDRCLCNVDGIRIEEICCDETNPNRWTGKFAFVDGTWDIDNCRVDFKPRIVDDYTCMIDTWTDDKNYLDVPTRKEIHTLYGQKLERTCVSIIPDLTINYTVQNPPPLIDDCINPTVWNPIYNEARRINATGISGWRISTTWIVEFVPGNTQPPGDGWSFDVDGWYRPIGTQFNRVEVLFDSVVQGVSVYYDAVEEATLDNAIPFKDIIVYYLQDCFDCIKSNFFGINADGSNPDNLAYQNAEKYLWDMVALQASDVIYANAQNNASNTGGKAGRKNWKNLWGDIKRMFNLCMWVEDNCLNIEHVSYRRNQKMIDLTTDDLSGFVKLKYTHDKDEKPKQQKLTAKFQTDHIDFDDGFIDYSPDCSDDSDGRDDDDKLKCFVTNISRLFNNEDYLDDDNAINSTLLVSIDENNVIYGGIGHKSNVSVTNAPLSMANIVRLFWTFDRPSCYGSVNGVEDVIFDSIKKTRLLEKFTLPFDCNKYQQINPETTRLKTKLGIADIKSLEWTCQRTLEVEAVI